MAIYNPDSNQHSDGSDSISYAPRYFEVHCFFRRNEGYSIPVKMTGDETYTDDEVIQHCIDKKLFSDEGDEEYVDYVEEITFEEYTSMKN